MGLYSMGYNIAGLGLGLLVWSFMLANEPVLIQEWENDNKDGTVHLFAQFTRVLLLLVIPAIGGLTILADPIFEVMTTEAYLAGAQVMFWVAFAYGLIGLSLLSLRVLALHKLMTTVAWAYGISGAVNLGLNLMFVPRFGYVAAAVNKMLSYGALMFLSIMFARKYLRWPFPWRSFWNAMASAMLMTVALSAWNCYVQVNIFTLILAVALGVGVYLAILTLLKEMTGKEKIAIRIWTRGSWEKCKARIMAGCD